jgi:quinol monooxygenase YgiN
MDLTIALKARSGKDQELQQALQAFLSAMRQAQGCLGSHMYRDKEEGDIILISMQWDAVTALEQYLLSNNGSAILGAIDLLGD